MHVNSVQYGSLYQPGRSWRWVFQPLLTHLCQGSRFPENYEFGSVEVLFSCYNVPIWFQTFFAHAFGTDKRSRIVFEWIWHPEICVCTRTLLYFERIGIWDISGHTHTPPLHMRSTVHIALKKLHEGRTRKWLDDEKFISSEECTDGTLRSHQSHICSWIETIHIAGKLQRMYFA